MSYLRNAGTGIVVGPITSDSQEYTHLARLRDVNGRPMWEDVPEETAEAAGVVIEAAAVQVLQAQVPAVAVGADLTTALGSVNTAANVKSVEYFPTSAVNGQGTNFRTLTLHDLTGAADKATLALNAAGVNLVANESNNIPVTSAPVAAADVLQWVSSHTGTGLADPGGLVVVTLG